MATFPVGTGTGRIRGFDPAADLFLIEAGSAADLSITRGASFLGGPDANAPYTTISTLVFGATAFAYADIVGIEPQQLGAPNFRFADGSSALWGSAAPDRLTGTALPDRFDISQGGSDTVFGGANPSRAGGDRVIAGSMLDAGDRVAGSPSFSDRISLSGAFSVVLEADTLRAIEQVEITEGGQVSMRLPAGPSAINRIGYAGPSTAGSAPGRFEFDASATTTPLLVSASLGIVSSLPVPGSIGVGSSMHGGSGPDRLGGSGIVSGGPGDDLLSSGPGGGRLNGGAGADVFSVTLAGSGLGTGSTLDATITVEDFRPAEGDRLRLFAYTSGFIHGLTYYNDIALVWRGASPSPGPLMALTIGLALPDTLTFADPVPLRWIPRVDSSGAAAGGWLVADLDRDKVLSATDFVTLFESVDGSAASPLLAAHVEPQRIANSGGFFGPINRPGREESEWQSGGSFGDTLRAAGGDDLVSGGAGDDLLDGGPGRDELDGGDGNDMLIGGPGDDILWGGPGHDTARQDGGRRGTTVTASLGEATLSRPGEIDRLRWVEIVDYADGRLVFDPADPAAQVVRLYQAALSRAPEQEGLNAWIGAAQAGRPLAELAEGFVRSAEFAARFGSNLTNPQFIDRLYQNVLGRPGDAEGVANWLAALETGLRSRAQVLAEFSESAENQARTADIVARGIWDLDEGAALVARMYDTVLQRAPEVTGLLAWKGALADGMTLRQMAGHFAASAEFQARFAALSDDAFVTLMYQSALRRDPEPEGKAAWLGVLAAGAITRADLIAGFSESAEHQRLTKEAVMSDDPAKFGLLFA